MNEHKKKEKQVIENEIIALPPLKMTLAHVNDEHVSKAALIAAIKKIATPLVTVDKHVNPQMVKKLIEHLEKNL